MSKWHKETNPVDRALSDINRKIESVERQLRDMGHNTGSKPAAPAAITSATAEMPARSVKQYVKEMLTPPARRSTTPARPSRRDLFDATDPMKELEEEPITFAQTPAPDLFAAATTASKPATATASAGEKLAHYLAAGTLRAPKPTLKHVQRENRNRFFMWLGFAGLIVLWLIILAIR
jgi:hypothetical protein